MEVICSTPSKLIVTHKEPTYRITVVLLCLAFILLCPVLLPALMPHIERLPDGVYIVLIVIFLAVVAGAIYIARCFETYTFDKSQQMFAIERVSPLGRRRRAGHLRQIHEVYQEIYDDNDAM